MRDTITIDADPLATPVARTDRREKVISKEKMRQRLSLSRAKRRDEVTMFTRLLHINNYS